MVLSLPCFKIGMVMKGRLKVCGVGTAYVIWSRLRDLKGSKGVFAVNKYKRENCYRCYDP